MSEIKNQGRETTQWTEVEFVRNRPHNFLGGDKTATIAAKEILDNCTDQISDGKTNIGYFEVGKDLHSLTAIDGGKGISTRHTVRIDTKEQSTFLFLGVAKMYNSTNYSDDESSSNVVGTNGVGMKLNNFLSKNFTVGIVNEKKHSKVSTNIKNSLGLNTQIYGDENNQPENQILGYHFINGEVTNGERPMEQSTPEYINVNVPVMFQQSTPRGFFVHAEYDTSVLGDEIDVKWLKNYAKAKFSQSKLGKEDTKFFTFKSWNEDGSEDVVTYVRTNDSDFIEENKEGIESGEIEIVKSWDEMAGEIVEENPEDAWIMKSGFYTILLVTNQKMLDGINNMVQSAPVENPKYFNSKFKVGKQDVSVSVYCSFKMESPSSRGLTYSDQTKRKITSNQGTPQKMHIKNLSLAFDKCSGAKNFYEGEANKKAMGKGRIHSSSYWPATGGLTARELYSSDIEKDDLPVIFKKLESDPDVQAYIEKKGISLIELQKELM